MSNALKKLLVVDDDPMIGRSIKRVLEKEYLVTTAADAKEALAKMQDEDFDLVYTDIKMPGMNGVELAEKIKAKQPWTPVVIITGYGSEENENRAKAAGVEGFLNKPLSPDMIEQSVTLARTPPKLRVVTMETAEPITTPVPEEKHLGKLASIGLFLVAPFIGLLYALALPAVGMAMLAYTGYQAFAKTKYFAVVKRIGLFLVSPFIGLMYAVSLPFLGLGMLAWVGGRALISSRQKTV